MYLKYKSKKFNSKAFLSAAALLLPLEITLATKDDQLLEFASAEDGRRSRSAPSSPKRPLGVAGAVNQGDQGLSRRLKAFGAADGAESVGTLVSAATVRTIAQLNDENAALQGLVKQLTDALEQMPAAEMDQDERVQALEAQLAERDRQIEQTVEILSNLRSNFFEKIQGLEGKRTHDQAVTIANLVKGMVDTLAETSEQKEQHQRLKLLAKKLEAKKEEEEAYKAQTERLAKITWRMSKETADETTELPKFAGNAKTLRAVIDHIEANIRATELEIQAYWAQKVESVAPAAGAAEDQVSAVDAAERLLRFSVADDESGDGKKLLKSLEALKAQHDSESRKMFGGNTAVKAALVNKMLAQARAAVEELEKSIGATAEYLTVIRESGFKHNPELLRQMYGDRAARLRQATTEAAGLDSSFVAPEALEDDGEEE